MAQLGSRRRQRVLYVSPNKRVGLLTLYDNGKPFHFIPYYVDYWGSIGQHPATYNPRDLELLEVCWDELHNREKVVKYYIKVKGKRRVYLSPDEVEAYKRLYTSRGQHPPNLYAKEGRGKYFSSGGPFTLIRTNCVQDYWRHGPGFHSGKITGDGKVYAEYAGGFCPVWGGVHNAPSKLEMFQGHAVGNQSPDELQSGLESLGAKAWNRARPRTSAADLATFLGELRELPTMLKTSAKTANDVWRSMGGPKGAMLMKDAPKKVAENFLNHSFGWAPFIRDLDSFYQAHKHMAKNIKQMLADNGQWVKRGVRVDETMAINDVMEYPGNPRIYPVLPDYMLGASGSAFGHSRSHREDYTRTWFVASFKYYIPRPPDNPETARYNRVVDMVRQYGLQVTPSTVWNLTPWTWLADWFGNAGDIVDNVTAQMFDNLTARYAYIMRHSRTRYNLDHTFNMVDGQVRMVSYREVESKTRVEANPFQFGLTGGSMSAYRLAILGALGLTR